MQYLWRYYRSVQSTDPLTWSELQAWSQQTRQHLAAWESDLIMTLDRIWTYGS